MTGPATAAQRGNKQMTPLPETAGHFGETVRSGKYGLRLTREQYALPNKKASEPLPRERVSPRLWEAEAPVYEDTEHRIYTDEAVAQYRADALENFDWNMAFFASLEQTPFDNAIADMLTKSKRLREVTRLSDWDRQEGVYVMVLDNYRQVYVGESVNIGRRIRQHCSGMKAFDRLLWGHKHESVLSIDAFRPLDTTRIFALRSTAADSIETRILNRFPRENVLNRIGGGDVSGFRALFITLEINRRALVPGVGPTT
jgi:hypothetical protein